MKSGVRSKRATWLSPFRVALLGAVVVLFLLMFPIHTLKPGDHEKASCGNALMLDLDRWRYVPDGGDRYYLPAHRYCTRKRVDRIALAVGVLAGTVLVVTALAARTARRELPDSPS